MTTLEKLCRAACGAMEAQSIYSHNDPRCVEEVFVEGYVLIKPIVIAVLSALEDPSDEMVRAGLAAPNDCWTDVELKGRFTAMIRKAKER